MISFDLLIEVHFEDEVVDTEDEDLGDDELMLKIFFHLFFDDDKDHLEGKNDDLRDEVI
jgi:hypothetical protein